MFYPKLKEKRQISQIQAKSVGLPRWWTLRISNKVHLEPLMHALSSFESLVETFSILFKVPLAYCDNVFKFTKYMNEKLVLTSEKLCMSRKVVIIF